MQPFNNLMKFFFFEMSNKVVVTFNYIINKMAAILKFAFEATNNPFWNGKVFDNLLECQETNPA